MTTSIAGARRISLPRQIWVSRLLFAAGLLSAFYYFSWFLRPSRVDTLALFIPLVIADLFNFLHGIAFWLVLSVEPHRNGRRGRDYASASPAPFVDVFVPTLNEDLDILTRTLSACRRLRWTNLTVHVLDDGGRWEVRRLATSLGVHYIAREGNQGAKAGNINHALERSDGEFVAVFDADHAPNPDFLLETIPEFEDPRMAIVQTPQVYGNEDESWIASAAAQQQDLFYQVILPGRASLGGAFSCGTNVVYRRSALVEVGGIAEDSIVEDMKTSMALNALGYEAAYVQRDLAVGLGPVDINSYWTQQRRWASGCLSLARTGTLWNRRLPMGKRLHYLTGLSYFASGWPILIYCSLPILRLLFGWSAVDRESDEFALRFAPYLSTSLIVLGMQSRGRYGFRGLLMHWGSFPIHIVASIEALGGSARRFRVTPKGATGASWLPFLWPNLLIVVLSLGASVYALLGDQEPGTVNNVAFAVFNSLGVGGIIVLAAFRRADVEPRNEGVGG